MEDDRLEEPVLVDVGDELAKLGPVHRHEREEGGVGVGLEPLAPLIASLR